MATEEKPAGAAPNGNGTKPALNVLAQYVKDLSFESPGAPNSLRAREKAPGIAINVNVNANPLSDKEFDVNLTLTAKASFEKDVLSTWSWSMAASSGSRAFRRSTCSRCFSSNARACSSRSRARSSQT